MTQPESNLPSDYLRALPQQQLQRMSSSIATEDNPEHSLLDLLKVFDRYRYVMLLSALAGLFLCALYAFTATPLYRAQSTIQIGAYQPVLMGGNAEEVLAQGSRDNRYFETQVNEITSLSVADRVLENENIRSVLEERQKSTSWFSFFKSKPKLTDNKQGRYVHSLDMMEALLGKIDVAPVRRTTIVQISAIDKDKEFATTLANSFAEEYINWVRHSRVKRQSQGLEFLSKQQVDLKKKVSDLEREMADYAEENSIVAVNEDENIVVQKMAKLNDMLVVASRDRIEAEKRYEEALKAVGSNKSNSFDDPALQSMQSDLSALQARRASLLEKYTPKYPKVKQIEAKIEGQREAIKEQLNNIVSGLKVKAEATKEQEANLKEELDMQQSQAFELSRKEVQFNALRRELASARELLASVARQIAETGLAVESNATNVSLVDYAIPPRNAAYPRKLYFLIFGLLGGLGLGIALSLVLNSLDNTIHTPEDLEEVIALPNLGVIPTFEMQPDQPALPDANGTDPNTSDKDGPDPIVDGPEAPLSVVKENSALTIQFVDDPTSLASEACRTIRTGILLSQAGEPPRSILFTSAQSSEGKSTIASNIAASLASNGAQVALIDCDLRRPSISRTFNSAKNSDGLAEVLAGQCSIDDVMLRSEIKNITVIPSGKIPPNPAELLGSEQMAKVLDGLTNRFDYVLLDSPPVLPVTDSVVLSKLVDGVVFVVRGETTPKRVILDAKTKLTNVGARFLGTVLNDIDIRKRSYGYYNKYHYSYYQRAEDA